MWFVADRSFYAGSFEDELHRRRALPALNRINALSTVILGDGELQEGQNYEAFQTIIHYDLRNITVVIDENGVQSSRRRSPIELARRGSERLWLQAGPRLLR